MIHETIKKLRTDANISQEELAKMIGISRPTLSQIETWDRELKAQEIQRFAEIFEVSTSVFLDIPSRTEKTERKNDPHRKMKNLILYILGKCGQRPNIGKTVLNKLLYFSDFNFYEKDGEHSISWLMYQKLPFGPVPQHIEQILAEMIADGEIFAFDGTFWEHSQKRLIPQKEADLSAFSIIEIHEVDAVISTLGDKTAKWISDFSHEDTPYKATKNMGDIISYGLAYYRTPQYSVRPPEIYAD